MRCPRVAVWIAFLLLVGLGCGGSSGGGSPDGSIGPGGDGGPGGDAGPCQTLVCGGACCAAGDECVQGACVPACTSGVRCGADEQTCCPGGDVCISQTCETPGASCVDSWDCADGEFCEPTLNQCLPLPTPPFCSIPPDDSFTPELEWHWTGHQDASGDTANYANVVATPVVADVDADGTPEVVFYAYAGAGLDTARLFIVDGASGATEHAFPRTTITARGVASPAIGNLDADPELEIVGYARTGTAQGVFILDDLAGTPQVRCHVSPAGLSDTNSTPSLANVNADPYPEIIIGGIVIDRDCNILFNARAGIGFSGPANTMPAAIGCNTNGCLTGIADLDGDPDQDGAGNPLPEIIGGAVAYRYDKTSGKWAVYWDRRSDATLNGDGFVAIAELDPTSPGPEVAVVSNGHVFVRNGRTGAVIPFDTGVASAPIGGLGGPPTIADFDGDGRAEIAAAGNAAYRVYDLDCKATRDPVYCAAPGSTVGVLWSRATQDLSSSNTGSSVFDFQGDGAAEVVYNDECFLRVYDGSTGDILMERQNSSRTGIEYPIVVDVDGDNRSEFLVVANNDQIARDACPYCVSGQPCGTQGVRAFGDPSNKWMKTRRVWNQHTYHITNIGQDGTVPATEVNNWLTSGLNNYRMNAQGAGAFNAPDLTISSVAVDVSSCPTVEVQARVVNYGSIGVPAGVPIAFYRGTSTAGTRLGTVTTTQGLLPGAYELVTLSYPAPDGDLGPFDFFVTIEEGGPVVECRTDNNGTGSSGAECVIIF